MSKESFLNKDIEFHIKNTFDWEKIAPLYMDEGETVKESLEAYKLTLESLGKVAGTELAPTAKETDEIGAKIENGEVIYTPGTQHTLDKLEELGGMGIDIDREYGGSGMPGVLHLINMEMLCRAESSFMTVYAFYSGVAKTLEQFGSEDLKKEFIPKLASGEYGGSMSLTEPGAGSDLGSIITKAEKVGDFYEITGNKIFISNGNAELSLVLARSNPDVQGIKGISMYLVPRHIKVHKGSGDLSMEEVENFELGKLEHKLGITGSPTLELIFDQSVGYLVGEEGQGVYQMFYLMNEARLGVAAQALGIAEAAYRQAKEYTTGRVQFGKPLAKLELVADKLFDMDTDIKAMRSILYKAAEYDCIKEGLEKKLRKFDGSDEEKAQLEKEAKKYAFLARDMVPLVKYFAAEKCVDICRDALQLHGGYGFMKDYPAERFLRDSIITPIYEGTSQIQALMATKDTLKTSKAIPYLESTKGCFKKIGSCTKNALDKKVMEAETELNKTVDYLRRPFLNKKNKEKQAEGMSYAMLSAEKLTRLKTYTTIAKILVDEAKQFPERKQIAERFLQNYLPEIRKESESIRSGDKSTLEWLKLWEDYD